MRRLFCNLTGGHTFLVLDNMVYSNDYGPMLEVRKDESH